LDFHFNQEPDAMPEEVQPPNFTDRLRTAWNETPAPVKVMGGASLTVFFLATVCALAGMYNAGLGVSQRWWLAAGWLMGLAIVLFSVVSALQAYTRADESVVPASLIMNIVIFITSGYIVVSFWTSASAKQWASSIVWSSACILLGGFAGFLFGIPRFRSEGKTKLSSPPPPSGGAGAGAAVVQGGQANAQTVAEAAPRASTATNDQSPIEQIADWLTKTIVGVALVNLEKLPHLLTQWASYVSTGIGEAAVGGAGPSFALGLIIYFTIVGFLSGYLLTQVFLQKWVNRAV